MKASEAKELAEKNIQPTEMEMQGIYNAIRGKSLTGQRLIYINVPASPQKCSAMVKILRDLGYKVSFSSSRPPDPDQFCIEW